jgi:hypothetical protein
VALAARVEQPARQLEPVALARALARAVAVVAQEVVVRVEP